MLKSKGTIERRGDKRYGYWVSDPKAFAVIGRFTNSLCIFIAPFPDGNDRSPAVEKHKGKGRKIKPERAEMRSRKRNAVKGTWK